MEPGSSRLRHGKSNKSLPYSLIGLDNLEEEILKEKRPVLLLCMPRDETFQVQINILAALAERRSGTLKVCLLEEEFLSAFSRNFNLKGTPTYIIFINGREKDRLLGHADEDTLAEFLRRVIGPADE